MPPGARILATPEPEHTCSVSVFFIELCFVAVREVIINNIVIMRAGPCS